MILILTMRNDVKFWGYDSPGRWSLSPPHETCGSKGTRFCPMDLARFRWDMSLSVEKDWWYLQQDHFGNFGCQSHQNGQSCKYETRNFTGLPRSSMIKNSPSLSVMCQNLLKKINVTYIINGTHYINYIIYLYIYIYIYVYIYKHMIIGKHAFFTPTVWISTWHLWRAAPSTNQTAPRAPDESPRVGHWPLRRPGDHENQPWNTMGP